MSWRTGIRAALIASAIASSVGCYATAGSVSYRGSYDTSQCYWNWVGDPQGGYEQMYCYHPSYAEYRPYYYGGGWVRRYPAWYSGARVEVAPPPVRFVRPRGVEIRPAPLMPPAFVHVSPPRAAPPVFVPPRGNPPGFGPRGNPPGFAPPPVNPPVVVPPPGNPPGFGPRGNPPGFAPPPGNPQGFGRPRGNPPVFVPGPGNPQGFGRPPGGPPGFVPRR